MNPAMQDLFLPRLERTADATLGYLADADGRRLGVTVELLWRNNEPNVSCIPAARYPWRRATHHPGTPGSYECIEIYNVPDRDGIHVHIANESSQLRGCVALGTEYHYFGTDEGVDQSTAAFRAFMNQLDGIDSGWITITDPPTADAGSPDV